MYCIENQHIFANMIKTFYLTAFNPEELQKFVEFSNTDWESVWDIILDSNGGDTPVGAAICEMINQKESLFPDTVCLKVIRAFSSAFNLLCKAKCKIDILEESRGMIHQSRWYLDMNANSNINKGGENYQEMIRQEMTHHLKHYVKIYEQFLTKDELNRFKRGEDIYFDYNRMKLIFNNKQNKNESIKSRKAAKKKSNS